ncbi:Lactococcin A secretion protein lcnD (plasmid) [Lactococcus lactis subsp. lactis]|jgi:bacteriocin secretion accessory protein|nr:Lactococcin A secretion protein lcnD [Lactococcus lactis subsp. lactis]
MLTYLHKMAFTHDFTGTKEKKMFDKKLLESSELYDKRYRNFSTLIILPLFILLIGGLIFTFFAYKELTVMSTGTIEPTKIIAQIQSTNANPIIENNLKEGKTVKENSLLLKYNGTPEQTQLNELLTQKQQVSDKKAQLDLLQKSLTNEKNEFPTADSFGYEKSFENYEAQVKSLEATIQKSNQAVDDQNKSTESQKQAIENQITTLQQEIQDYSEIENAISSGGAVSQNNPYLSQYNSYQAQQATLETNLKNQKTSDEEATQATKSQEESLKSQFLSEMDSSKDSLKSQIQSFSVQESSLTGTNAYDSSQSSQILTLKSQALSDSNKEMTDLNSTLTDLETKISLQKQDNQYSQVFAEQTGILHVLPDSLGMKKIPIGTTIAEIYPSLKADTQVNLTSYIPSTQIAGVKVGQKFRFIVQQDLPKAEILTGTIKQIDSAPTTFKEGNAYKVFATTTIKSKDLPNIRYGLQGKTVTIIGKKTYFNYYLDKVLGKNR